MSRVLTRAIVNPSAGNGAARHVARRVLTGFAPARAWDWVTTERPGHAADLAREAAALGYERVIAVGGDGTACEVANGLAETPTVLGMIPAGTGNDTAMNLGIPRDPIAAASLALAGTARPIDLGEVRTARSATCFLNVAGIGFDAEVAWRVNRLPWTWTKPLGGTLPYLLGVVQTLCLYRSARVRLCFDQQPAADEAVFMIAVANCASYGGGIRIAPDARPDDGRLDVCVVRDLPRLDVLRLVPRLYSGGHVGHPAVHMMRARGLSVDGARRVRCQADGEVVGELPAHFSIRAAALRCVTPVPATGSPV
jgi:YegS/Rv2252/BmrU family lipid kinase